MWAVSASEQQPGPLGAIVAWHLAQLSPQYTYSRLSGDTHRHLQKLILSNSISTCKAQSRMTEEHIHQPEAWGLVYWYILGLQQGQLPA